ncbi:CIC11C00000003783 [Sungouiella intermedia]|uniref:Glutamate decarboxylase n=1 Tax=Sungouiella intermedia TaxID=45354 RepID=A0A1L0BDN6_9ASCO|nr:CIC11C00000003783 [[Candida] intermedia]SGZ49735.1 CIC11C00000002402 [[Candida] intermedia]
MTLSHHVDSLKLESQLLAKAKKTVLNHHEQYISSYYSNEPVPKYEIPKHSTDGELVYKYMKEGLSLDGIPSLNLASFVNTEVDDVPLRLISENIVKNLADNDEYPSLIECQERCINILSNLWNAPKGSDGVPHTVGCATTGSSEAIMLAGLAMKKKWQEQRKADGKPSDNPNILMASVAQVALEKFARYFDVENRLILVTEDSHHLIDVSKIKENIDENTIGIFVIMGSTFTGAFEPVAQISKLLDEVQKETGHDIKIHVDGASGGFVAPFVYPHLKWDFSVDRVVSINTSGHKFGLTTAGLGWVIWRELEYMPESLRFKLDYLGGLEETFGLNFSRPGFTVLHQYYNFLSLGREGYTKIFHSCIQNARLLSRFLEATTYYECLSVIHKPINDDQKKEIFTLPHEEDTQHSEQLVYNEGFLPGLPVVAFRFSKDFREKYPDLPQSMVSLLLRNKQFIVPNYHLPPDELEKEILRVVVRDLVTLNLLEKLMNDIVEATEVLIRAHDSVVDLLQSKEVTTAQEKKDIIYKVLLSITSNGTEDVRAEQIDKHDKPGLGHHKHKKSYRGAC